MWVGGCVVGGCVGVYVCAYMFVCVGVVPVFVYVHVFYVCMDAFVRVRLGVACVYSVYMCLCNV